MKRTLLVMLVVLAVHGMLGAAPVTHEPGVVSYSVNYSVYFDNEADAMRWLESHRDFTDGRESSVGERRIMATMMQSMIPGWSYIVRMHSDYLVMVVRSPNAGESSLSFYVRGELTRLWQR